MDGFKIVEQLIVERARAYGLDPAVEWLRVEDSRDWIARITVGDERLDVGLTHERVDDLPGHVREQDGELVPIPRHDTFLGETRSFLNREVDRLAKQAGKKIGF